MNKMTDWPRNQSKVSRTVYLLLIVITVLVGLFVIGLYYNNWDFLLTYVLAPLFIVFVFGFPVYQLIFIHKERSVIDLFLASLIIFVAGCIIFGLYSDPFFTLIFILPSLGVSLILIYPIYLMKTLKEKRQKDESQEKKYTWHRWLIIVVVLAVLLVILCFRLLYGLLTYSP